MLKIWAWITTVGVFNGWLSLCSGNPTPPQHGPSIRTIVNPFTYKTWNLFLNKPTIYDITTWGLLPFETLPTILTHITTNTTKIKYILLKTLVRCELVIFSQQEQIIFLKTRMRFELNFFHIAKSKCIPEHPHDIWASHFLQSHTHNIYFWKLIWYMSSSFLTWRTQNAFLKTHMRFECNFLTKQNQNAFLKTWMGM